MKRRDFLSGLTAAPLAMKARLARFFARKPVQPCGAPIFGGSVFGGPYQFSRNQSLRIRQGEILKLMAAGKIDEGVASRRISKLREAMSRNAASQPIQAQPFRCSRARGHKGPHMLLNPS